MTTTKVTTINVAARHLGALRCGCCRRTLTFERQPHQGAPSGRVAARSSSPARVERTIVPGVKKDERRLPASVGPTRVRNHQRFVPALLRTNLSTPTTPPDIMKLHLCLFSVAVRSCTVLAAQHAHRDTLHASSPSGHLAQCMHIDIDPTHPVCPCARCTFVHLSNSAFHRAIRNTFDPTRIRPKREA